MFPFQLKCLGIQLLSRFHREELDLKPRKGNTWSNGDPCYDMPRPGTTQALQEGDFSQKPGAESTKEDDAKHDASKSLEDLGTLEEPGAGVGVNLMAIHTAGRCSPCLYFASDYGCHSTNCRYCHLPGHSAKYTRPEKAIRDDFKERLQDIFERQQAKALAIFRS